MNNREHIIRRITFDIDYNREQDAKALQDRYSRLFNNSLAGMTEKVIEQVMDPAESIWLKRVEIDLGEVSYHSFEEEIIRLWPEALEKMLTGILAKDGARQDSTNISLHFRDETERRYALLEHYLYTGSLPWWAAPSEGVMLEDMLLMLIHASTQRFTHFMMGLSQQEYVLKRIIYHFSRNAVQQIITALEEEQSTFIFRYITSVIAIHSRQQVVKAGQSEFEKAVWLFVLTYLVTDNSGQFNRKQFIRRNLERLARHFNIDYVHLLYIFRRAIDHYRQAIPPESFATFIQVLYEENDKAQIYTDQPHAMVVMGNDNAEQVMAPRLLKVPGANGLTLPLPLLWIHYDNILAQADKEEVWQQAVDLFTIYITGQQLPYWFSQLLPSRQEVLLKQAVILLFRKRPFVLAGIWEHPYHSLQARLTIHQLFERPVTPVEENIRRQLQIYAEQDTLQFLQQALPHTFIRHRESFRELWLQYRQRTQAERMLFYRNILAPSVVMQQVALHTRDEDFWKMMEDVPAIWGNHTIAALREWQQLMETMVTDNLERERIRLLFRQFNLQWLSGRIQINDSAAYIKAWLHFIGGIGETTTQKLLQAIPVYNYQDIPSFTHIQPVLPLLVKEAASYLHETKKPVEEKEQTEIIKQRKKPVPVATSEQEGVPVTNAGLILLHPFFHTYFSRLQLLEKGQFINEGARQKAIRLLQLLVDGQTGHPEQELLLNRVLCNCAPEVPLDSDIVITDAERDLAAQLVRAAIAQWEKMNKSSLEGFRASFLKRDGIIWQTDEAWFLKVTTRSYDIIMQTLPWSVQMFKPAWNNKILYTEWTLT